MEISPILPPVTGTKFNTDKTPFPSGIVLTPNPDRFFPTLDSILPKSSVYIDDLKIDLVNNPPKHSVADIFRETGEQLLRSGKLSGQQCKVVYNIMNCRTGTYGYHADICDSCGFVEVLYNSCRNRHCPQCQGTAKKRWVNERLSELLPVAYHHVVFTVPSYISMLSLYNQRVLYDLLFQAAAQTLLAFGKDPKHLGAEPGFYGILHTWSQTMTPHIHIHIIITAGGLTAEGKWKEPKHSGEFLFPVRALSKVFRGKFIEGLKNLYYNSELRIPDSMPELSTPKGFERKLNSLVSKSWRVHSKPPFSGPEEVVRYIGRYTHRIAISDGRIRSFENGKVTFSYKDNTEKNPDKKMKEMTLSSEEFIRRFLYHVLPERYHRIRNFGFLSNGRKRQNIEIIRSQLPELEHTLIPDEPEDTSITCPVCENGKMKTFLSTDSYGRITTYDFDFFQIESNDTS